MNKLKDHSWPGNIRELQNVIERAVLLSDSNKLEHVELEEWIKEMKEAGQGTGLLRLEDVEKNHILEMLDHTQGNRTLAASQLGISVRTLRNKLKIYQIA